MAVAKMRKDYSLWGDDSKQEIGTGMNGKFVGKLYYKNLPFSPRPSSSYFYKSWDNVTLWNAARESDSVSINVF